jgi:AP2 domain.
MKLIPLTQGLFAKVDDGWFEELNQYKWYAHKNGSTYYAEREVAGGPVFMHRVIMNTPKDLVVDHIDHNGLNCLEENMRNCTRQQNRMNLLPHGKSKYLGVSYHTTKGYTYIKASIRHDGVTRHIGLFPTEEDAARAYDEKAKEYHGEFANLNFK